MQRDQKVGLALGVLLIGAVAAFFFRNEPDPGARIPQLESAEAVNREIAQKRLTPYFSETEIDDSPRNSADFVSERRDMAGTRTGERKLPRWDELLSGEHDPFAEDAEDAAGNRVPAPAPDPIPTEARTTETVAGPPLDSDQVGNSPQDDPVDADSAPAETIHEVQRGETLSSIAGRYLGSQARFHDIFEANKGLLQDANDLRVGMKLRIPLDTSPATVKTIPATRTSPARETKPDHSAPTQPEDAAVFMPAPAPAELSPAVEAAPSAAGQKSETAPVAEQSRFKFTPAKRRGRNAPAAP